MALKQWVNLPKLAKYEGPGITKERLGPLTMELEFDKTEPMKPWKLKITPVGSDNATYSRKEMGRNKHFKVRNVVSFGVSDAKKVLLEETVHLPSAGGNKYKIETKDGDGKTVGTPTELETRRKLYYQVVAMTGVTPPSMSDLETEFWNPSKKYYLKLAAPEAQGTMKYYKNVRSFLPWASTAAAGRRDMFKQAKVGYKLKKLHPFCFVIVCSNMIGSPKDVKFTYPFTLYGKLFRKRDEELEITVPGDKALWFGVDDIDDAKNGGKGVWLNYEVKFDYGQATPILLDKGDVTLGPKTGRWYQKIKVNLKKDLRHWVKTRKGTLELRVKIVGGFSGGYSDPMANFITIGSAGWQAAYPESKKVQILIHEVGHKVGMVADGKGRAPAAPPNLYGNIRETVGAQKENNKGHSGPHCEKGMTYNGTAKTWSGTPGCVMYGATASGGHAAPKTFCSDCEKVVRKLDVDARVLSNFKHFITDY